MSDRNTASADRPKRWKLWLAVAAVLGAGASFGVAALLTNIAERKAEGARPHYRVVELNDTIDDPAIWGRNHPHHYEAYMRTEQMVPTRHGGSLAVPREPTPDDPRTFTSQSKIEKDPRMAKMWAGYPFAADFREERGHRWNFLDQRYSRRQTEFKMPGTCINCHASTYVAMKREGQGDLMRGFEKLNAMPYDEVAAKIEHPVTCIDCHDPATMQLRITRPGLIEGMAALKASQGVQGYDVNVHATRQEMRTLVCAQCHVEYHFKGDQKRLTFPWKNGLKADAIYDYYFEADFADWTHKLTSTRALKAQHPEYEMYSMGVHARSGVACADCHMPFMREGAQKISDHHVRSPLLNVNRACQSCHKWSEQELIGRVETIQDTHSAMVSRSLDALMALIDDLERVQKAEGDTPRVVEARELHRRASWFVDFVEAENSTGFHAPQEAARLLGLSLDYARQGQLVLSGGTTRSAVPINLAEMRNPPNKPRPATAP